MRSVWHPRSTVDWLEHLAMQSMVVFPLAFCNTYDVTSVQVEAHVPSAFSLPIQKLFISFWSIAWSSAVEMGHWQMVTSSNNLSLEVGCCGRSLHIGQTILGQEHCLKVPLSPMAQSSTSYHQHDNLLISQEALDPRVCTTGDPIMGHLVKQALEKSSPQGLLVFLLKVMREFTDFSD